MIYQVKEKKAVIKKSGRAENKKSVRRAVVSGKKVAGPEEDGDTGGGLGARQSFAKKGKLVELRFACKLARGKIE